MANVSGPDENGCWAVHWTPAKEALIANWAVGEIDALTPLAAQGALACCKIGSTSSSLRT